MPLALVGQQATVSLAQVKPVVNELVVEKSQPKTCQQGGSCKEAARDCKETSQEEGRNRQAINRSNQDLVRIPGIAMMADVKGSYDLFESAIVRSPMKEEAMQQVLQQAPEEPTQWNQPQELPPWGALLK